ncbi:gamma-glutamyl-gamma-aminobutyrate hydrolase family protein [Microbacterium indicum]|uniref:gamma-glutamyl-gamma-aminobutyrate hydrolase family protein n=1 Tax=Microbacterium indicum TaxID=358100 RepID=UPI0004083446|nr:gamma-glutamyl-gamma-aminobutyrate hydrolase family protein [Microbacterium indicum]
MPHAAFIHVRTQRDPANRWFQDLLEELNAGALAAAEAAGMTAALHAAAEEDEGEIRAAARDADLVVILGGDDVDPALFGAEDARDASFPYETRADAVQAAIVRDAVEGGRPLLGVCRGNQLLNVVLGGTLDQEMTGHRRAEGDGYVSTPIARVDPRGLDAPDAVLCTHHQAIDRVADPLVVTHRAADGVVEAVAHRTLPIRGVQWHPEHPRVSTTELASLMRQMLALA